MNPQRHPRRGALTWLAAFLALLAIVVMAVRADPARGGNPVYGLLPSLPLPSLPPPSVGLPSVPPLPSILPSVPPLPSVIPSVPPLPSLSPSVPPLPSVSLLPSVSFGPRSAPPSASPTASEESDPDVSSDGTPQPEGALTSGPANDARGGATLELADWLVPSLALGVPILVVLAAIVAQVVAGAGWAVAARKVLGSPIDRFRRRPVDGA